VSKVAEVTLGHPKRWRAHTHVVWL